MTETDRKMTSSILQVQHQIRANASDLQTYFSDLYSWEKTIEKQDLEKRKNLNSQDKIRPTPPIRVKQDNIKPKSHSTNEVSLASHTYDKGYDKWNKFDVEAALQQVDTEENNDTIRSNNTMEMDKIKSTIISKQDPMCSKDREEIERLDGNAHYKQGDYVAAIKSYTKCLGYNAHNVAVLSNRAMAYIKNREYQKAEIDCTHALQYDSKHIKSLGRRGTARNALGKHRLALWDFQQALELDTIKSQKQWKTQIVATKELLRTAIKRAPKRTDFTVKIIDEVEPEEEMSRDLHTEEHSVSKIIDLEKNAEQISLQVPSEADDVIEKKMQIEVLETSTSSLIDSSAASRITTTQETKSPKVVVQKLPKKAPTTSYEFLRVWRTLLPKRQTIESKYEESSEYWQLVQDRLLFLQMITPSSFRIIFKTSMESDVLMQIIDTFYQVYCIVLTNTTISSPPIEKIIDILLQLTKVPRFQMSIMFLTTDEKQRIATLLSYFQANDMAIETIKTLQQAFQVE